MNPDMDRDPPRDPALERLLREVAGEPPAVDWAALGGRIGAAAQLPLARRGRAKRGAAALLRSLVPLAAAAGVAAAYLTLPDRGAGLSAEEQVLVEQMVNASLPESVDQLITGEAAQGALLEVVTGS